METEDPVIKWMRSTVMVCHNCRRSTRHDVGVKYVDGKEIDIRNCLHCKTLTES
jgi:hypothetical protein